MGFLSLVPVVLVFDAWYYTYLRRRRPDLVGPYLRGLLAGFGISVVTTLVALRR